jgi:hypothetical protein
VDREICRLIREMSGANPLWGAPRIHGELLKLGIEISQATVAKYMVRGRGTPSPTWRSFLRNQTTCIAAIDMFVVASASFRLLYVMIILTHDRRKIVRFDVTRYPTAGWLARQVTDAFPWDTAPRYLLRDRDASYGAEFCRQVDAMGITEVVTAARSPRLHSNLQRAPSAPDPVIVCRLLPPQPHASFTRQGLPGSATGHATKERKSHRHPASEWLASPLRTSRRLIRP